MEPEKPHREINYIYFGAYLGILLLMIASSVLTKDNLGGSRIFFFLYAFGQALIETCLLALIATFLPRRFFYPFIGATFFLVLIHIVDFFLERILDLSIWETIGFVLDESWINFIFLLDASGVPFLTWGLGFLAVVLIPFLGVFLYRISSLLTKKKPLQLKTEKFLLISFCIPVALLLWDIRASNVIHPDAYTAFIQSLPWKFTFLEPKTTSLTLPAALQIPASEEIVTEHIRAYSPSQKRLPNIYLFIVESLRRDIIDEATAPHLYAFGKTALPIEQSFSNANGTHHSWFSIFHSQFPFTWSHFKQKKWSMGSPSLNLLKQLGYKLRVYSSAQLGYYGMEEMVFGAKTHLIDSYQTFHHAHPFTAADSDRFALQALQKDVTEDVRLQEGQICIVFLDATHFDYSWPKNWPAKFTPFSSNLAYFDAFYSHRKIESIKNRYRNAVHYVDSLFGAFLQTVPQPEKAIVIATGDHGEEFFEHGHLFHNSHLVNEQTQVPIYIRLGQDVAKSPIPLASHVDIFPTLLDHLFGINLPFSRGISLVGNTLPTHVISARFNASRSPYEFFIYNGKIKLISRFSNQKDPLQSSSLHIRSIRGSDDRVFYPYPQLKTEWILHEFDQGLRLL